MGSFELELDRYRPIITTSGSAYVVNIIQYENNPGFKEHNTEEDASGDLYLLHFQGRLLLQCSSDI